MENTFALWGFIIAACIAVILVYASIADRWYRLQAQVADLEAEKDNMQRWLDKQRTELVKKQDQIAELMMQLRTQAAKKPAVKKASAKKTRTGKPKVQP